MATTNNGSFISIIIMGIAIVLSFIFTIIGVKKKKAENNRILELERRLSEIDNKGEASKQNSAIKDSKQQSIVNSTTSTDKNQKIKKFIFIAMPIYYGVLFLVALICLLTHCTDTIFTNKDASKMVDGEGRAYSVAILLLIISMIPALLLYYSASAPIIVKRQIKVALFILGIMLLILMVIIYIVITNKYGEIYRQCGYVFGQEGDLFGLPISDREMFPFTVVMGAVAFIIYYASCVGLFRKVRGKIGKIFSYMNNNNPVGLIIFNLVLTILLPIFASVISFVIAFAIVAFLFMLLVGLCKGLGDSDSQISEDESWEIYENGFNRTLRKTNMVTYVNGSEQRVYKDDIGREWLTDDGGKTFYLK